MIGVVKEFAMLRVVSALKGYKIEARDGSLGTVSDLLFDDRTWRIRWLVVDTGTWLSGRKVLIHPSAIGQADDAHKLLPVSLTKAQVDDSPNIAQDRPVSAQMETELNGYYGWDPLWSSGVGGAGMAWPLAAPAYFGAGAVHDAAEMDTLPDDDGDPHLRSVAAVTGYHIHAMDGAIGHVEDVLVEDEGWTIGYLIVDTRNWWPGRHVLIAPHAVRAISMSDREVQLDVTRQKIKDSPPWTPYDLMDRGYRHNLHTYYGWPVYEW